MTAGDGHQLPMKPGERTDFMPIVQRPKLALPDNKRIIAWPVVNVEEWDVTREMPRTMLGPPGGQTVLPDIPNWTWHEYGMRVGIWRIMDALGERGVRPSAAINACVCQGPGEPVARAMHEAGWPFMGHGHVQAALHTVEDQRENITQSFQILKDYTGTAPKGWLGPGLHETLDTLDYLAEAGFKFVCDWPMDEQPTDMQTSAGPITAMPYNFELSDLPMMVVHQHESRVWLERAKDQFDRLYAESATQPRVMSMSVHPYIMGVPHRIKYFEAVYDYILQRDDVWVTTPEEIYDWHRKHSSGT
jgi:peptidoglycan/xylan/chitin deacetylase (PgdA/CDA1 family)